MKIRRIISMVLCLCFLTACASESATSNVAAVHIVEKDYPEQVEIYNQGSFYNYDSITYAPDAAALEEWTTYMNSIYPFSVVLKGDVPMNTAFTNIKLGLQTGLTSLSASYMLSLIKEDKILPLDEYLKDNKAWSALPEEYRKTFEFEGHIWAVPNSGDPYARIFSIRKDWLEAVKMDMPTNTAELLEVGRAFMRMDANGNGKADDYLLGGYPNAIYGPLFDAFGCYMSDDYTSVTYDPSMDCIVDNMFKPKAKEALQYIRTLLSEGLIDPLTLTDSATSYKNMSNGEYGLTVQNIAGGKYYAGINWTKNHAQEALGHDYDETSETDFNFATGIFEALPPLSDEYPILYQSRLYGYVLASGTEQPKETANAFVNMVLGSKQAFMECYFGIPERFSFTSDNGVAVQLKDVATMTMYASPRILNAMDIMFDKNYHITYAGADAVTTAQNYDHSTEYSDYEKNYKKRYSEQLYEVPILYKPSGESYISKNSYISSQYRKLLNSLSDETHTIDEILYNYRQYAILWSMVDLLKESNEALGLENKQVIE